MKELSSYGSALLGPETITINEPKIDFRLDAAEQLIALIWPDEPMEKELNAADIEQIMEDRDVCDVLQNVVVSDAVRRECEAEMREAEKRGWTILD